MSILVCSYLLYLRSNWWDMLFPMTRDDEFDTRARLTVVCWSSRLWKIVKSFCARRWRSDTDRFPIEYERLPTDFLLEYNISSFHNGYKDYIRKIVFKKNSPFLCPSSTFRNSELSATRNFDCSKSLGKKKVEFKRTCHVKMSRHTLHEIRTRYEQKKQLLLRNN